MSKFWNKKRKYKTSFDSKDISDCLKSLPKLSEFISEYTLLKKLNCGDYMGRCPICDSISDKHLRISDKKKIFKCFNCGSSGKTIPQFLMKLYDKPFGFVIQHLSIRFRGKKMLKNYKHKDICELKVRKYNGEKDDLYLPF